MTSIIFESSSSKSCLILAKEGKPFETHDLDGGSGLSQKFFSLLEELLRNGKYRWDQMNYLACGAGPGAFTGVRIAAAIAQTLSYAKEIPLITFSSLHSFVPPTDGPFFTALDAKSFGIYLLQGQREGKNVTIFGEPRLVSLQDCRSLQPEIPIFSADAQDIQTKFAMNGIANPCREAKPNPQFLTEFCQKKYEKKQFSSLPLSIAYLRDT